MTKYFLNLLNARFQFLPNLYKCRFDYQYNFFLFERAGLSLILKVHRFKHDSAWGIAETLILFWKQIQIILDSSVKSPFNLYLLNYEFTIKTAFSIDLSSNSLILIDFRRQSNLEKFVPIIWLD